MTNQEAIFKTVELKPCPFCGRSAVIKHLDALGGRWFYIKCKWCYAEINNLVSSEKEAVEAWNKRANDGDLISRSTAINVIVFNSENKFTVDALNDVPAVDAVPVVHGRWYDKGSLSCRCSCCGCKSNKEYNYCPNCGAKMDKEK